MPTAFISGASKVGGGLWVKKKELYGLGSFESMATLLGVLATLTLAMSNVGADNHLPADWSVGAQPESSTMSSADCDMSASLVKQMCNSLAAKSPVCTIHRATHNKSCGATKNAKKALDKLPSLDGDKLSEHSSKLTDSGNLCTSSHMTACCFRLGAKWC